MPILFHLRCHSSIASPGYESLHAAPPTYIFVERHIELVHELLALVVEDEPMVRMALVDFLSDNGLDVREAGSADDAWRLIEAGERFDIVYTDVNMPGELDGLDLAHRLHRDCEDTRIVILSGRQHPDRAALPDGAVFLTKPYRYEDLLVLAVQ